MKAILLADLHIHHHPAWRLEWCAEFCEALANKFKKTHRLYLLGDVFEVKDKISARCLNIFIKMVADWGKCNKVVWITGQHDSYLPGVASLSALSEFGTRIVDSDIQEDDTGIWMLPYARDKGYFREMMRRIPDGAVVFTHLPTVEGVGHTAGIEVEGISVKEFARFKRIFSGDIHKFFDSGNFTYIGAPSQRNWSDEGVQGRIGELDLDTMEFKRIGVEHPEHIRVGSLGEVPADGRYVVRCSSRVAEQVPLNVLGITYEAAEVKESEAAITEELQQQDPIELLGSAIDGLDLPKARKKRLLDVGGRVLNNDDTLPCWAV